MTHLPNADVSILLLQTMWFNRATVHCGRLIQTNSLSIFWNLCHPSYCNRAWNVPGALRLTVMNVWWRLVLPPAVHSTYSVCRLSVFIHLHLRHVTTLGLTHILFHLLLPYCMCVDTKWHNPSTNTVNAVAVCAGFSYTATAKHSQSVTVSFGCRFFLQWIYFCLCCFGSVQMCSNTDSGLFSVHFICFCLQALCSCFSVTPGASCSLMVDW